MKQSLKAIVLLLLLFTIVWFVLGVTEIVECQNGAKAFFETWKQTKRGGKVPSMLFSSGQELKDHDDSLLRLNRSGDRVNRFTEEDNPFKYSGFIEVNSTYSGQMYYVFMEAQNGNPNAPVIAWFQGGPGSASIFGLFVENGPYLVDPTTLELVKNKYTWNADHHMIWIDNPLGSGFSHVKSPGYVHSEDRVASELHIFLIKFFQLDFAAKYKSNPLYLFGESYAGKYIPSIAYNIMNSGFPVNLVGIGIGDGLTHPIDQFSTYDTFSYSVGLIDQKQQQVVQQYQNQMVKLIQAGRYIEAMDVNNNMTDYVIGQCSGGVNVYDIRTYGDYDITAYIKYVEQPYVKQLMHTVGVKYYDSNPTVWNNLYADIAKSVRHKVEALLDCPTRKIRVLLYNGQYDWLVNYIGASKWIDGMKWRYSSSYLNDQGPGRKPWKIGNQVVGYVHAYENLIQLVVNGAGHLSPMDQPRNVLEMVRTFTSNRDF
ncbi:hypothetical protein C9374_001777 [Naegleria lovaniensis]|uniref:Carboxypeptidase n=1 Tax=Naegleria lovaniensis TaxID=51637 RepID=A0AA88KL39_NAELO|nr:uncharacterized protein C9374_001777 [Naegleria lovaniensis]KAG2387445.1 hypothetical protein C9374_001777 [Naegleria lovaniensis]